MSFTVQAYIDQVRSVHPAFSRFMVSDQSLADCATREQRRLMTLALMRDRRYLAQSMSILFDIANASNDAPGTAGVSTTGGVPAESDGAGGYRAVQATTGNALTLAQGTVLVTDTAVSAATATTLTGTGVTWVVNAYAGDEVYIVAGKGAGSSPRTIASNTSSILTVTAAFEVTPDGTSVFRVVQASAALDTGTAVVTNLPATTMTRGYLVKLNAQGQPYLDVTAPVVGHLSRGIPLPSFHTVIGGTVRFTLASGASADTDYDACPLTLVHEAMRGASGYPAFLRGQQLYLMGGAMRWQDVESIELFYVPVPPAFTSRGDLFLLPDSALPALVAQGAVFAASRIAGLPGVPQVPASLLAATAGAQEAAYLDSISLTQRARISRVRPGGM